MLILLSVLCIFCYGFEFGIADSLLKASPEQLIAQEVIAEMRSRGVFASIDIHNNTGRNPHYGCITRLDKHSLQLARLFNKIVVHYTSPKTVQSYAFAEFCPAIVVECGQPDVADGTADRPAGLCHRLRAADGHCIRPVVGHIRG